MSKGGVDVYDLMQPGQPFVKKMPMSNSTYTNGESTTLSSVLPQGLALVLSQQRLITQLCEQNAVSCLELFGSATTPNFDPNTSDLDFLVEFATQDFQRAADRFFNLKQGLTSLLTSTIDLVELKAVKNPYFLNTIATSRVVIYGSRPI